MAMMQPVDRLEFQVLIDNVTDSLSSAPPNVTLEWPALMRAGMRQMSGKCQCCANHGLSLVVRAFRGTGSRAILFDAGPVEFAAEYNGTRLGIEFKAIDAVVLSHGHWDHAGGLPMALELIRKGNGNRPIPCCIRACSVSVRYRFRAAACCRSGRYRRRMSSPPRERFPW